MICMFDLGHNLYSVNYIIENCLNWCVGYDFLHYGFGGGVNYDMIVSLLIKFHS